MYEDIAFFSLLNIDDLVLLFNDGLLFFSSSFALFLVKLVVELKKITTYLVKGFSTGTSHSEVAVVLGGLHDLIEAFTFNEMIAVVRIGTHC